MNSERAKKMGRPSKGRRMVPVTISLATETVAWIQDHVDNVSAWLRGLIVVERARQESTTAPGSDHNGSQS